MDVAALKDWLPFLQLVGTGAVFVVALWLRSRFVPREEFDKLSAEIRDEIADKHIRLERGNARFDRIDQALAELPKKSDLYSLGLEISRLSGSIDTLGARIEGGEQLIERIESSVRRHEAIFAEGRVRT